MNEQLLQAQQYYISSALQFLALYLTTSDEPHLSHPRLFLAGHALECIAKAAYISTEESTPQTNHDIEAVLSKIGISELASSEERKSYDDLYGAGFKKTRNFNIGLFQENQEVVEILMVMEYLKDLKYGTDLKGNSIFAVIVTGIPLNQRYLMLFKTIYGLINRQDLDKINETYSSIICNAHIREQITQLTS